MEEQIGAGFDEMLAKALDTKGNETLVREAHDTLEVFFLHDPSITILLYISLAHRPVLPTLRDAISWKKPNRAQ